MQLQSKHIKLQQCQGMHVRCLEGSRLLAEGCMHGAVYLLGELPRCNRELLVGMHQSTQVLVSLLVCEYEDSDLPALPRACQPAVPARSDLPALTKSMPACGPCANCWYGQARPCALQGAGTCAACFAPCGSLEGCWA